MKIRRIVLLVLLAAGSVFLLSSCDALLDAIFSNDTITVYVSANIPTYYAGPPYILSPGTDTMTVYITGTQTVTTTATYTGYNADLNGIRMYWSVAVPKLTDGTYSVQVYYYHPFVVGIGTINTGTWTTLPQSVTLPAGSSHSVALDFSF